MNGAKATIESLKKEGVKVIFGLPGTTIMHLLDSMYDDHEIRYISVRHEQVAAFMADGYARGTNHVGVCLASRGPGAANMAIGLHNAYSESIPIIAVIGQVADAIYYRDSFEEMDLVSFFKPITKWSLEVHKAERIPELVQRAVRTSLDGRPRPVMVSLPLDIQMADANFTFQKPMKKAKSRSDSKAVLYAAQVLLEAKKPLLFLGGGVCSNAAIGKAVELAEKLYMPALTTWRRKSVFPNNHSLFIGTTGPGTPSVGEKALKEADVILAVGTNFSEFGTYRWSAISNDCRVIHVDIDSTELGKIYIPEVSLLGDAFLVMEELSSLIEKNISSSYKLPKKWVSELQDQFVEETTLPPWDESASPVPSAAIIAGLEKIVQKRKVLIVEDAASFGAWLHRYFSFEPGTFYAATGGSMGWGFPAAMGLKIAKPDNLVINVVGDGAFWMVAQDIETAVRENIPVINVVTNNYCYGNTRERQKTAHNERYIGVWYKNPDFAEFARLLGAYGERVEKASDFVPAMERAIQSGLPAIVDVVQDVWEGLPPGSAPATAR